VSAQSEGCLSYVDLQVGILQLFVDAARMGRRKEFHVNALMLQRQGGEPQPKCIICGSQGANHRCPGIDRVVVSFPLPTAREEKKAAPRFDFSTLKYEQRREFQLRAWDTRGRRCSPEEIERAFALRAEGRSKASIALAMGIPVSTLKKALKRAERTRAA